MKAIDELRNEIRILRDHNNIDTDELVRIADAIERELKEEYVELPKDVNNIPIHIGDVLQNERCDGGWCNPFEVIRMKIGKDGWVVCEFGGYKHGPNLCRHKPPTVEDILREFADLVREEQVERAQISDEAIAEFAERLQLREGE